MSEVLIDAALGDRAVALLQALLRVDTSNPPGNETAAAALLADVLQQNGVEPELLGPDPARRSLVARLRGDGSAPPLLLSAHLDVVPADPARWRHPPFGGVIADGYLWGRGAIDMKHMAAMAALVLCDIKAAGLTLRRDIIFAAVADEEMGCDVGSRYLCDHHRDRIAAEYALTEVGGFTLHLGGQRLYPIQVAERGIAWLRMTARGPAGHGSMPRPDSAVHKLGKAIAALAERELPMHLTGPARTYLAALLASQGKAGRALAPLLTQPSVVATVWPRLLKLLPDASAARALRSVLGNTVSPTVLSGGQKTNVIPAEASVELDGRLVEGQSAASLVAELRAIVGEDIELQVLRESTAVATPPESPVFDAITAELARFDPGAVPIPYMIPGFTDAQAYSRLGTRCFGFAPVRFPADGPRFAELFHGDDERIPVDGLRWGVSLLRAVVQRLCC